MGINTNMLSFITSCTTSIIGRAFGIDLSLRPVVLHLTLTDRCNLKCRMCNIWRRDDKKDISSQVLQKIAASKYGRSIRVLDITGGEPFIGEIEEAIESFSRNRLRLVFVSTNGVLTKTIIKKTKGLLSNGDFSLHISVSLDGIGGNHDFYRGVQNTFDRVEETIFELKKLGSANPRLKINIKSTLLPGNVHQIVPLYEYAMKHGVDFTIKPGDTFSFLDNQGMDFRLTKEQTEEATEALRHIIACEKKRSIGKAGLWERIYHASNIIFHEELIDYLYKKSSGGFVKAPAPCLSSFISVMVHSDGKVYSCPTLMKEVGDISGEGFDPSWRSDQMKETRKFIRKELCACFSQCDQMPSILLNHKARLLMLVLRTFVKTKSKQEVCLVHQN